MLPDYFGRVVLGDPFYVYANPSSTVDPLDVWILAGGSNMVGENSELNEPWPTLSNPSPGRILQFPVINNTWYDAESAVGLSNYPNYPRSVSLNTLGPEMCFANTLLNYNVSRRVGLVPVALGGTILHLGWTYNGWLYNNILMNTRAAMAAAGPTARLRGLLFMEGEGSAMAQYNTPVNIASLWTSDFMAMVNGLRTDLAEFNPGLPVVLAVQRVANRSRVYPLIGQIKAQQENLTMPNLLKARMEDHQMFSVNFSDIYGPYVGMQAIHFTKQGSCNMGVDFAWQYITGFKNLTGQLPLTGIPSSSPSIPRELMSVNDYDEMFPDSR